jgi:hypothetical protein
MQGNAFLGAFFRVSTLLKEFGITQEQYRAVVHKQYVKKFGKLGEAVVESNMEVMMQGFDQVKEIKIGALTAADHSSLRGRRYCRFSNRCRQAPVAATGCRSTCAARRPGQARAARQRRQLRRRVPLALRL